MARKLVTVAPTLPPTWRLFRAITNDDLEIAKTAIEHGADVNHVDEPRVLDPFDPSVSLADISEAEFDWRGHTPLTFACRRGRTKFIQLLVDNGAQLDLRDRWQLLPLEVARQRPAPDIVKLLVSLGAPAH